MTTPSAAPAVWAGAMPNFALTEFYEVRCPEFAPGFGRCHH